ncbi:MAG TPA: methyltransferase domain-containing protein [Jiangellaceae bacterium]|jgi:2-polyprenyl-3-methyl-5-hydroxy-6-metoxy-1,4-benzoquinol methylase|nr:methyltransferase domain-containing protein [Jiangellaceae bacterium]
MDVRATRTQDLLSAQWRTVEHYERMSFTRARLVHAADLRADYRSAIAELPTLTPWPKLPDRSRRIYGNRGNMTRVWRVCRFLSSDDRVLDIGIAHGWLPGMIARAVGPRYYAGVDVDASRFDSVWQMAQVNGIDASGWFIGVKNLYDLTADWVTTHDPTIVLLLEVLEHLPDAQLALTTIANAIPPDTELLFSVPMFGRVESCWGHVSLFDADRVRQLCAKAGLVVHWVEPVANTWQLLLVSRSTEPPARLARLLEEYDTRPRRLARARRAATALPAHGDPSFHAVQLDPDRLAVTRSPQGTLQQEVRADDSGGVRLVATAAREGPLSRHYAAVAFRVEGLRVLRFEVALPEPGSVSGLVVEGRDEDGRRTVRWTLSPTGRRRIPKTNATYVLRPGRSSAGFRAARARDPDSTRVIEVIARIRPGSTASIILRRVAYVR